MFAVLGAGSFGLGRLVVALVGAAPVPVVALTGVAASLASGAAVGWLAWPSYGRPVFALLWWAGSLAGTATGTGRLAAARYRLPTRQPR